MLINMSIKSAFQECLFSTHQLKVLSFLAKRSDREFHEREIARRTGISYGSANRVLNGLFADGLLGRRPLGKILLYSYNSGDPLAKPFKIFVSVSILRPLVKKLRECASEIVLYGSCARGEDGSGSDIDLFVISEEKEEALRTIDGYKFGEGFEDIKIEPVILSPLELLKSEKTEKEFLSLVREGIVLWDEMKNEAGVQGLSGSGQDHPFPAREKTRR
jgi:predicted nucleotidyltransferase